MSQHEGRIAHTVDSQVVTSHPPPVSLGKTAIRGLDDLAIVVTEHAVRWIALFARLNDAVAALKNDLAIFVTGHTVRWIALLARINDTVSAKKTLLAIVGRKIGAVLVPERVTARRINAANDVFTNFISTSEIKKIG